MRTKLLVVAIVAFSLGASMLRTAHSKAPGAADWALNMTAIESCSCPMFCQCYFNTHPAGHAHGGGAAEHYCRFNMAWKVNKGNYGNVKLDGAKFWIAGDLGGDFSKGQMDWAVLTYEPAVTPEQRDAISKIVGHLFPVKWNSFNVAPDAKIAWEATNDRAQATLDSGKAAEVVLRRQQGNANAPIVIQNLKYWGAPRNDGFILMPNEVNAYRVGEKAFETRGTNGFMITIDISSKDVQQAAGL